MLCRQLLFALFVLALNGCGSDCRDVTCDDLINVIFSSSQTGDYVVQYEGQDHPCVNGEPGSDSLAACGPNGFLINSGVTELDISVQSDEWTGSTQATLEPTPVLDAERTACVLPCSRAETILMIESQRH